MSNILRRPMFRGGPVSSYGTGIASGLAEGGRVGYEEGGDVSKEQIIDQVIKEFPNETIEFQMKIVNQRIGNTDDRSGFEKFVGVPKNFSNMTREEAKDYLYNYDNLGSSVKSLGSEFVGNLNDSIGNFVVNPLIKAGSFVTGIGDTSNLKGYNTKQTLIDKFSNTIRDDDGNIISTNVNEEEDTKTLLSKKRKSDNPNNPNNQNDPKYIPPPEKSDKEVIQEYMDMFKETLGGDKDELNRQRYLEIAKFGANLLAQPGGQSLGEAVGKAGAPALEGFSKIEATERLADRQAKSLGFQAALKELEGGTIDKNIKDLQKYMPRDQAIKVATSRGDATKQSTIESRIQYYADVLLKGEGAPKDARVARAIAEKINASGVDFFKFEPFDKATIIEGNYYYDKNGKLYKGTEDGVQELNIT